MKTGKLEFTAPAALNEGAVWFSYIVVEDAAFPLEENLPLLYTETSIRNYLECRVFNYRLNRETQVIEYAFGILTARFRVFGKPLEFT